MAQNTPKPKAKPTKPSAKAKASNTSSQKHHTKLPVHSKHSSGVRKAGVASKASQQSQLLKQKAGSNMTSNLEKMLAERAGYTELVSKGSGRERRDDGKTRGGGKGTGKGAGKGKGKRK